MVRGQGHASLQLHPDCPQKCIWAEPSSPTSITSGNKSRSPWEAGDTCDALHAAVLGFADFCSGLRSRLPCSSLRRRPRTAQGSPSGSLRAIWWDSLSGEQSGDNIPLTFQSLDLSIGFKVNCLIPSFSLVNTVEERVPLV